MSSQEILIVGCSIAGPTLATCLLISPLPTSRKPRITILERSASLRTDGQNVDIRGAGVTIIRKLGIEKAIRASTTGEEGVQFVDAANRVWAAFAADKSGQTQTGTSDIEILRGRLSEICFRRSKCASDEVQKEGGPGIEYIFGDSLDALEQNGDRVHVRFARSGQRRSFDLVVGADGLPSATRRLAWGASGEEDRVRRVGMYAAFFSLPRGPTDTAWRRWFHAPGRRGIFLRPDEQRERTTALLYVVNDTDKRLPAVAAAGREDMLAQKALVSEYFRDAGWECPRLIREMNATKDFYYDPVAQVKLEHWSKGRVVLLGDAGYCASPISGMGTTLAMNGAWNLAGALSKYPDDHKLAFAAYEDAMRPVVARAQKLPPGMPKTMNPETAWGIWILHAILGFFAWTRLSTILFKLAGPRADKVPVDEFGFRQQEELED